MQRNSVLTDRAAGVLLASAAGDALGVPYEFAPPPTGDAAMLGGGPGDYAPGEYSDDTQMAVCIARVAATGADLTTDAALDQIADAFLAWYRGGATTVGSQTRAVLTGAGPGPGSAQRLREVAAAVHAQTGRAAGNGALMRTGIVGLVALDDREHTAACARAVAELTHPDPLAGDSCVLWSEAVRRAVLTGTFDVAGGLDLLPAQRRDQWATWLDEATGALPASFPNNGFTVPALQAAWAAITSTPVPQDGPGSFACEHLQRALHAAVRAGNDPDTVAAIAGALLGARWGGSAVSATWRRRIHGRPMAGQPEVRSRDLVRLAVLTVRGGQDDEVGWPSVARVTYDWVPRQPGVPHPLDDGVVLGTTGTLAHECDAVVSLCRRGPQDLVPGVAPQDQVDVWLMDSERPEENPNLAFVLADAASVVAELRDEGHRVLLHCVAASQRTPTVAVAYAVRRGAEPAAAARAVLQALPTARGHGLLWDAVSR